MRIGIIGSGHVGRTIADGALRGGHEVRIGAREPGKTELTDWADAAGDAGEVVGIEEAAAFGALLVNATTGTGSVDALRAAGSGNLGGKTLIDIGNAVEQTDNGMVLAHPSDDSLAEEIQREFPDLRVVKALNTMHREVMTTPEALPGDHTVFICGDDSVAKDEVRGLLAEWGWKEENILDLGGLRAARGLEMFVILWVDLFAALDRQLFNVAVVRA
jgi:8-hydroxy-5-deazaflavin:NADPH oxidoreductase